MGEGEVGELGVEDSIDGERLGDERAMFVPREVSLR